MKISVEPVALYLERHGYYPTPAELIFAKHWVEHCDGIKAAKKAGFTNLPDDADKLFSDMGHLLRAYREDTKQALHRADERVIQGMDACKVVTFNGVVRQTEVPDHAARTKYLDLFYKRHGAYAPEKKEIKNSETMTPEVREKLDEIKQGIKDRAVKG